MGNDWIVRIRSEAVRKQLGDCVAGTLEKMMAIPLVDLAAQYKTIKEEIGQAWEGILGSMKLFLGPHVQQFEKEFARFCGTTDCVGVGSGTEALQLALRACGVESGDEVVTVTHTFIATVEAIWMCGARPVFVDIDPITYTIDAEKIEEAITPRTRAIIPVHLYGQVSDMREILKIARRYRLKVIEDASQAHGAVWFDGEAGGANRTERRVGSIGDCGAFSFYFSKNLGAYGEAGAVVTRDMEIANRIRQLRDHGQVSKYEHEVMGFNSRIDELQAAVLEIKLKHLDSWNELRRRHAAKYSELLEAIGVMTPAEAEYGKHVYHLYVVRMKQRDALRQYLQERGVATGIHYLIPCHLQNSCARLGYGRGDFPVSEMVCKEILSLPMYPELSDGQIMEVVERIGEFLNRQGEG